MLKSLKISVDQIYTHVESYVKVLAFKDLNSEKYFLIQKDNTENTPASNYHIEVNDQINSCYDGIKLVQIFDDKIIFNLRSEHRKKIGFSAVIIALKDIHTEITEHEIYSFFDESGINIKNYLGVKLPNHIVVKVQSFSSNLQLDYSIHNMSNEEYQQLSKEVEIQNPEDYYGEFQQFYTWKGMEVILQLGEKYDAEELVEYRKKYHPYCTESIPYLLDDGRVLVLSPLSASLHDDEYGYLQMVQKWPKIEDFD